MATSRIFIGGIPPGTTSDELIQRFKSFGDVKSCEVVPDKEYPGVLPGSEPMVFSRNFGFVTIEPKDEKSLQRAIAVYNGSLWRGCTLRCKLAKPTAMEQLAEERKEDAEISNEPVDYTLPITKDGITLRIRQPFNRQLVPVMLGGSKLKLEKLGNSPSEQHQSPATSASLENNKASIVSTPLKPRKTFEQHLRECAEKYAASEEGQQAAAARQDRLENTKAAAAMDQETAVNLSMNKDAAALIAAANKKAQKQTQAIASSKVLPAKRSIGAMAVGARAQHQPPPAQRSRIVDFLSDEDFTAINQQQNTAIDLSRFGSDSEEEEERGGKDGDDGGNNRNSKGGPDLSRLDSDSEDEDEQKDFQKSGGPSTRAATRQVIPQVDGAADSDTTTETSSDSDDTSDKKTTSSSSSESEESSDDDDDDDDEEEEEEEEEDGDIKMEAEKEKKIDSSSSGDTNSDVSDSSSDDDEVEEEEVKVEEPPTNNTGGGSGVVLNKEVAWMSKHLPAGASFFRQDPLVQVEGSWRAGREAAVREYKERRRQALRQAGKKN